MTDFFTNREDIKSDLLDEVRLFFPYDGMPKILQTIEIDENNGNACVKNFIAINDMEYSFCDAFSFDNELQYKRIFKRKCKLALFSALSQFTGKKLPWGSLTGIRPSKLVYDMLNEGLTIDECEIELCARFFVSKEKSKLICDIVKNQNGYYNDDRKAFNLYLHIPFCTSKCNYCSFTTQLLSKSERVLDDYVAHLRKETEDALEFINKNGRLLSVYIGGGTPTALSAEQLYALLNGLDFNGVEYTVECGRPDTITTEKLEVVKKVGATRICVNPQSLNDDTLLRIGRAHTADDFYEKYALSRSYGFDINVDTIAGLSGETIDDFIKTINGVVALSPENITVHTLSMKNGSQLSQQGAYENNFVAQMTDYAQQTLIKNGYFPYYLYRQKQMLGNLENVGYCKENKQCLNNVTTMEECASVIACGAGSITKAVTFDNGRITRFPSMRDVKLYLERFEEKMTEKERFLRDSFIK